MTMTAKLLGLLVLGTAIGISAPAAAVDWRDTVNRAIPLLDSSNDSRTICMLEKIKEDGADDRFVADYFNVQQTAGGLPDGVSFGDFVNMISNKLRDQLGKDSLYGNVTDDELASGVRTYDNVIYKIFKFVNANVHQAGAGEVHKQLYGYILDNTKNSSTLYSCYSSTFVDER